MKLSDVMGAANLAIFAEAALVLFFVVFVLVLVRAAWPDKDGTWSRLGRLPLEDDRASTDRANTVDAEGSAQ